MKNRDCKTLLFLGVGNELTKQFLIKYVNENHSISTVITVVSYENLEFNFNRDIQFIPLNFFEINIGNYPEGIVDIIPADKDLIDLFSSKSLEVFKIMDRIDLYSFTTYNSRFDLFITHIEFWNSILKQKKVDLIISSDMPHEAQDYIAYCLGEIYKIKRCFLVQTQMYHLYQILTDINSNDIKLLDYNDELNCEYIENPNINAHFQKQMDSSYIPFYMENSHLNLIKKVNNLSIKIYKKITQFFDLFKKYKLYKLDAIINYLYLRNNFGKGAMLQMRKYYESVAILPDFSREYIYFPLHFQPERTTSPQGGIYGNQGIVLKMLSYNLPHGWTIYVKEHPRQKIGGRDSDFYKNILELPNVKLLKKNSNSLDLILKSKVVASITGTAAWEAFCHKIPVIIFGNIFFKYAEGVFFVNNHSDLKIAFNKILKRDVCLSDKNVIRFINYSSKLFYFGAIDPVNLSAIGIDWEENLTNLVTNINNYLKDAN